MFNALVQDLAERFGLGTQAENFVRAVLAYAHKPEHGGLPGFVSKFEAAGLGQTLQSWLGGGEGAQNISPAQIETVLGNNGGLISQLVSSTGIARQSVTPALAHILPALIGLLTPGGQVPTAATGAVAAFIAGGAQARLGAIAAQAGSGTVGVSAAESVGQTMLRWIPWLILALLALAVLGWCSQKNTLVQASADTVVSLPASPAAVQATVQPTPAPAPLGAGVLAETVDGKPLLKVYFDVSRVDLTADFAQAAATVRDYLKEHPDARASISGFNDPSGDAAKNVELAKQRAQAVEGALLGLGVDKGRIDLIKPSDATLAAQAGANNAELRRVEVRVY